MRLGQATLRPIGFQTFCGRYTTKSDAQVAALAEGAMIPYATLRRVSPSMPEDAFVFDAPPGDPGGVVAVSARLGLTVFAASVRTVRGRRVTVMDGEFDEDALRARLSRGSNAYAWHVGTLIAGIACFAAVVFTG